MVKLNLPRFGGVTVEFESNSVINFPVGLLGFETCRRFKLFHQEGKPNVLWLQSLDQPEAVFSLRDPALLNISYEVTLSDAEEKLLETAPGDDIVVAVIVYKDEKTENKISAVKANMFAPIILNVTKRNGIQKVLKELDTQLVIRGG